MPHPPQSPWGTCLMHIYSDGLPSLPVCSPSSTTFSLAEVQGQPTKLAFISLFVQDLNFRQFRRHRKQRLLSSGSSTTTMPVTRTPARDRNVTTWTSKPRAAFSDALSDYFFHLDVKKYDHAQRTQIWHNATQRQQARQAKRHGPALPYDLETEENSRRLLPTFTYHFNKRGDFWTFWNFRFSDSWKVDPETGSIVVPNLDAWSKIVDNQNHFRQAQGWPLIADRLLYGDAVCKCGQCPNARFRSHRGRSSDKQIRSETDINSLHCFPDAGPFGTLPARPSQVRFLLTKPEARVKFMVNSPDSSNDADSFSEDEPSPKRKPRPLKSILVTRTIPSTEQAQLVNASTRPRKLHLPQPRRLTCVEEVTVHLRVKVRRPETKPINITIRSHPGSKPIMVSVRSNTAREPSQVSTRGASAMTSSQAEAMATSTPNSTNHAGADTSTDNWPSDTEHETAESDLDSNEDYVSLFHDFDVDEPSAPGNQDNPDRDNSSQSSIGWEVIRSGEL